MSKITIDAMTSKELDKFKITNLSCFYCGKPTDKSHCSGLTKYQGEYRLICNDNECTHDAWRYATKVTDGISKENES